MKLKYQFKLMLGMSIAMMMPAHADFEKNVPMTGFAPAITPGTVIYESTVEDGKVFFFLLSDRFKQSQSQLPDELDFKSKEGELIQIALTNDPPKGLRMLRSQILASTSRSRKRITMDGAVVTSRAVSLDERRQTYSAGAAWDWKGCTASVAVRGVISPTENWKSAEKDVVDVATSFFFHENPTNTVSLIKKRGGTVVKVKPNYHSKDVTE